MSAFHKVKVDERCLWICSEKQSVATATLTLTQLLLKPLPPKRPFTKPPKLLPVLSDSGSVRWAGYSVNMFIIYPVSRAGGQMCAIINGRLRPLVSDVGTEVVALVVKTNTRGGGDKRGVKHPLNEQTHTCTDTHTLQGGPRDSHAPGCVSAVNAISQPHVRQHGK